MSGELTETPNQNAVRPTGMCSSSKVCTTCPLTFICSIKAGEEMKMVAARKVEDCASCGELTPWNECPKSQRSCGHHCNHSWEQDICHWCGVTFGENGVETTQAAEEVGSE